MVYNPNFKAPPIEKNIYRVDQLLVKTDFKAKINQHIDKVHQIFTDKTASLQTLMKKPVDVKAGHSTVSQSQNIAASQSSNSHPPIDGATNINISETTNVNQTKHRIDDNQVNQAMENTHVDQLTVLNDPPAAATATAANLRHQKRQLRLEEQKLLRTTLRDQFSTTYKININTIAEMKTRLQADKL